MNFRLARELYSGVWMCDPMTAVSYLKMLDFVQAGGQLEGGGNSFDVTSEQIATYNFDSVITKGGGDSHYGTIDIAEQFKRNENDDNVKGHVFMIDSGGGSGDAPRYITDAVKDRKKPLIIVYKDIACSASIWLSVDSDYIFAETENTTVGSVGAMFQFEGYKANEETKDGLRVIRAYATQSTEKNIEFEQAINNLDVSLLKSEILDPACDRFISHVKKFRQNVRPEHLTGKTFPAKDVIGIFVDEIGNFDSAVLKINELLNINTIMNKAELIAQYPSLHAEIFAEGEASGVAKSDARVAGIMAWHAVNPEEAVQALQDGTQCDNTFVSKMNAVSAQKMKLKNAGTTTEEVVANVVKTDNEEIPVGEKLDPSAQSILDKYKTK